jgi:meso-butanediol dehydrogenase/(S,S)-butanediol dehydrogenase/diacetyl reductase
MAQDKSVVVTGAAGGIGRSTCERLAKSGWSVLAVDHDAAKLGWAAGAEGITTLAADVSCEEDNARMAAEAERRFGGLDAAVFNAGIGGGGSIDELPTAQFQRIVGVNMFGPVLGVRAVLPLLRKTGGGAIAITSSTMGVGGEAENWAYSMTKHALIGLVQSLSREIGWEGIRINALCPGPTLTAIAGLEGADGATEDALPPHYHTLRRVVPLQRWAHPDEMASVIEFLLSPAASYVNGHALVADGGAVVGTGLNQPKNSATATYPLVDKS